MTRDTRSASATRIAATLGGAVAVVMLAIWAASAIAGAMHGELKPEPKAASAVAPVPTASLGATKAADPATVAVAPKPKPAAPKPKPVVPTVSKPSAPSGKYIIVIDPGHGGELSGSEPLGPWAGAPMKARTNTGADGEAQVVLQVALKLRPLLEAQGVKVIMTRTAPAAISNKDRAMVANNAHADLFLRLHCDGIGDTSAHGISMQVPADSRGWAPISQSRKAGDIILAALVHGTGAPDRGIAPRSGDVNGLVGFEWSKVPTCLPEMGFLSNPSENARLHSASYQDALAKALAEGTMSYLHTVR